MVGDFLKSEAARRVLSTMLQIAENSKNEALRKMMETGCNDGPTWFQFYLPTMMEYEKMVGEAYIVAQKIEGQAMVLHAALTAEMIGD